MSLFTYGLNPIDASVDNGDTIKTNIKFYKLSVSYDEIEYLINLSNAEVAKSNYEEAMTYLLDAQLEVAHVKNTDKNILNAMIYNRIAWIYFLTLNYDASIEYCKKAIDIGDESTIPDSYNTIASVYYIKGDYANAAKHFIEAAKGFEVISEYSGLASAYNNLASVYVTQNDSKTALSYLFKSIELLMKDDSKSLIINTLNNIGVIYYNEKMLDSAAYYYDKALIMSRQNNYSVGILKGLMCIASLRIDNGKYYESENILAEARELAIAKSDFYSLTEIYFSYAQLNYFREEMSNCIMYLDSAYYFAKKYNHVEQQLFALEKLSFAHSEAGNYKKALEISTEHLNLKDSVFNIQKALQIDQLRFSFETEQMSTEIESLNKEKKYQRIIIQKQKLQNYLYLIGILMALIFSIFISLQYYTRNKAFKKLVKKNQELIELSQKLDELQAENFDTKKQVVTEERKEELIIEIEEYFREHKPFMEVGFNLNNLSEYLNTNRTYLSKIINEVYSLNFPNFINEYRIKEACKLIAEKKYESETIQSIAETVGFKSPSAFIEAFKKFTGVTPSFYIKEFKNRK